MNRATVFLLASACLAFLTAASAQAQPEKVEQKDWQEGVSLPSYVNMYIHVPTKLAAKPAILVASHHCQGTGPGTYKETERNLVPLANDNGFIMIFPEATGRNCWDVGSDKSLKHDGGGDTHAVAQMVRYVIKKHNADPGRVYAFGGSSGGMMTQALLGVYPDVFMAGVSISGVPCGCWSDGYDKGGTAQWSNNCAGGKVSKTAQEWGDYVRGMYPDYKGHRPRVQLWHGDPDSTINFNNMGEAIKEWTNLHGMSVTPTEPIDTSKSNTTHQTWKNDCGKVLETFSVKGAGHGVQWDTPTVSGFLALDKEYDKDSETAACPDAIPGGAVGAGGAGGSTGAAGDTGSTGGSTGSGGNAGNGGGGTSDSTARNSGGQAGAGTTATSSGTGGAGGKSLPASSKSSGGASSSSGGSKGGASSSSSGGSKGGASSSSGDKGGALSSSSSSSDQAGSSGSSTLTGTSSGSSAGCAMGGRDRGSAFALLALTLLGLVLRRQRRK